MSSLHKWPSNQSQTAQKLAKLNLHNFADLLLYLPIRYEDHTQLQPIDSLTNEQTAHIQGTIQDCKVVFRPRRQLQVHIEDTSGEITARWLNFYPSLQKQMQPGKTVRLFGTVKKGFWGCEMVHPNINFTEQDAPLSNSLTPIYPTTSGISQTLLRQLCQTALQQCTLEEFLPESCLQELQLPDLNTAIHCLHAPKPNIHQESLIQRRHPAWQRIKFEELLAQQIIMRRAKNARHKLNTIQLNLPTEKLDYCQQLLAILPFQLTQAQQRVTSEIFKDLAQAYPMHRLLQGDVGSGKTIVAALAMLKTAQQGYQSVLMAPTEILAEQHYLKFQHWLKDMQISVAWITGSQSKKTRQQLLEQLTTGEILLAIGTHALIEEKVNLPKLALAIVDEQHRFGVNQRLLLRQKTQATIPHMLMMSATPIPRSLAMAHYADLNISSLDELPPSRKPVTTHLVSSHRRAEIIQRVAWTCENGEQVYWVCPLIEESEKLQLQTAEETLTLLQQALPQIPIALIHGKLKSQEKTQIMNNFASGHIQLLVATTVIEVGVDVPNASLMVIEHAERFGLAQLHQLRGRVGRGQSAANCVLMYAKPLSKIAKERLRVMYTLTDGFKIAEQDLHIRGPGEFIGDRQSGIALLQYADLEQDHALLESACTWAEILMDQYPDSADKISQRWSQGKERLLDA